MVFQLTAASLLLIFYGCYFAKMLAQRRKGIRTDQIGRGKSGMVKRIEITMKIATCLVPLAEIVSIALDASLFAAPVRWVGFGIALLGDCVFICSVVTMQDNWRAGVSKTDRTSLVTRGIYRISRNPAFLGFDLVYIGILLMFFNWALLLLSVFAALMFHLQIVNVEEDFLQHAFGEEYSEYKRTVNRYLGRRPARR